MKWLRRPKRKLLMLTLFIVAGAIINVAVAWGCARWSVPSRYRTLEAMESGRAMESRRMVYRLLTINPGDESRGFGLRSLVVLGQGELPSTDESHPPASLMLYAFEAGWPKQSLAAEWRYVGAFKGWPTTGILHGGWKMSFDQLHMQGVPFALPLWPIWPGFAINTIFHAGMLWLLFTAPGFVRRRIRIMRHHCPACAYPIGTNRRCTECGTPLAPSPSPARSALFDRFKAREREKSAAHAVE